jgi:hypothetical protein
VNLVPIYVCIQGKTRPKYPVYQQTEIKAI